MDLSEHLRFFYSEVLTLKAIDYENIRFLDTNKGHFYYIGRRGLSQQYTGVEVTDLGQVCMSYLALEDVYLHRHSAEIYQLILPTGTETTFELDLHLPKGLYKVDWWLTLDKVFL